MTSITLFNAEGAGNRVCGACQLCCKLLPVLSIAKPALTKCHHQHTGKGCALYANREPFLSKVRKGKALVGKIMPEALDIPDPVPMPVECQLWSCKWLADNETAELARPDRSHYVIDMMPDMISAVNDGREIEMLVVQVWIDPGFPDAHRDPALRRWMAMVAKRDSMPTIVRYGSYRALLVIAPCMTDTPDGPWMERMVNLPDDKTDTRNRFVDRLTGGRRA